jgi:hypothetical protein
MRIALAAALLVAPLSAAAAEPPLTLDLGVEMYAAGVHALSLDLTAEIDARRYRVDGWAQTRGMMDFLVRWRSHSSSEGRVARDGELRPELHRVSSELRWSSRDTLLRYDGEGRIAEFKVAPPPEKDRRKPVPPELSTGTLDTLSAALVALQSPDPASACRQGAPVFDGRRRYDVTFHPIGEETLKPNKYSIYAGPALKCEVEIVRIRGFQEDGEPDEKTREHKTWVWFARPPGMPVALPIRLEVETEYGYGVAHLVRAQARAGAQRADVGAGRQ